MNEPVSLPERRRKLRHWYWKNRVCTTSGCITILCYLNPGPQCWRCTERAAGRRRREPTAAELMEAA